MLSIIAYVFDIHKMNEFNELINTIDFDKTLKIIQILLKIIIKNVRFNYPWDAKKIFLCQGLQMKFSWEKNMYVVMYVKRA